MKPFPPPRAQPDWRFLVLVASLVAAISWVALYALIVAGIGGSGILAAILALAAPATTLTLLWLEWTALFGRHRRPLGRKPPPAISDLWPLDARTFGPDTVRRRSRVGNDR